MTMVYLGERMKNRKRIPRVLPSPRDREYAAIAGPSPDFRYNNVRRVPDFCLWQDLSGKSHLGIGGQRIAARWRPQGEVLFVVGGSIVPQVETVLRASQSGTFRFHVEFASNSVTRWRGLTINILPAP
jgi:hypothetical protein